MTEPSRRIKAAVVAHHLRLFGAAIPDSCERKDLAIALQPAPEQLRSWSITIAGRRDDPQVIRFPGLAGHAWDRARTLQPSWAIACERPHDVLAIDEEGRPSWIAIRDGDRTIVIIGSDLGGDLVRYRQGDPARAASRPTDPMWGIPGERPAYLFDHQIAPGADYDRPADCWARALAECVATSCRRPLTPVLPHGAPGAVVVTGDDDQAYLDKYDQQLGVLDGLPITYFLHPQTRHSRPTLEAMTGRHRVELGLHPDALEQPERYAELFVEQAAWFERLTGAPPALVRNHGFLNDGYWGHLPAWLDRRVLGSANLPGVNGRVLNGSLLPARMVWQDAITDHWSILTAIGDGVRFALAMDGPQSARCVLECGERITQSKLPGVIVLNLHPQNVAETIDMHRAVRTLVETHGFVAMTLGDCLAWFAARDRDLQVRES